MSTSTRHSDNDGSDIFWPGYVDAVTNLVLNLLFLLTIMIVAVFMFALELGRASLGGSGKVKVDSTKADAAKVVSRALPGQVEENAALKREIQLLKSQLEQQAGNKRQPERSEGLAKTIDATSRVPKPLNRIDKTLVANDREVLVRFIDEAVAFTPAEHDRLYESLKPVAARGKISILVDVPDGFSEAKRMGFYRAMAVRNVLIEMKVPKDSIDVTVRETGKKADASIVRVKSR